MTTRRHTSRKRFPNWLRELIDNGEVNGVYWLDKENTTFRVPWTRVDSPEFDLPRDAMLFQKWAEFTGRYRVGERTDPSVWKTRFRCAIRKMTEIEELKMANNLDDTHGQQPFRVFRFKKEETSHPKRKEFKRKYKCRTSRKMVESRNNVPLVYGQYHYSTSRQIKQGVVLAHGVTQSVTQDTAQTVYNGTSPEFITLGVTQSNSLEANNFQHSVTQNLGYFPMNTNNFEVDVTQSADSNTLYRPDQAPVNAYWPNQMGIDIGNTIQGGFGTDPSSGVQPNLPRISLQDVLLACSEPSYIYQGEELTGGSCITNRLTPYTAVQAEEERINHSNQIFEDQGCQEAKAYNSSLILNDLNEIFQQSIKIELERGFLSNNNGHDALKMQDIQDCMLPIDNEYMCDVY